MLFQEAVDKLGDRTSIGSDLSSGEWADVPLALRERAFFSSRVESVRFLDRSKGLIGDFLEKTVETLPNGDTVLKTGGRARFVEDARRFALGEGMGPLDPKDAGGIKDITSQKRLELIFDTQTRQAQDYGYWRQGQDPDVLELYPAQRLVREQAVKEEREWHQQFEGEARLKSDVAYWISINQDFGVPWGPWGWGCGHDVEDVDREEAEALGLIAPGEAMQPADAEFNQRLEASTRNLDPDMLQKLVDSFGDQIEMEPGPTGSIDVIRWAKRAARTVRPRTRRTLEDMAKAYVDADSAQRKVLRDEAREMISLPEKERVGVNLTHLTRNRSVRQVAEEGAAIVSRYTAPELLSNTKVSVNLNRGRRAYHRGGGIFINGSTSASVAAHEITHAIEQQNPKVLRAAADFLLKRGKGETPKSLRSLTGIQGYSSSEIALEDKWKDRGGSVYAGKVYTHYGPAQSSMDIRATEVLTMGIERLHADPLEFFTNDREWFEFTVNTLRNR